MKRFMRNNKGLSLVELLIALVIGSILVVGVGSIMVVSSRSFSSTSAEAAMQSSAQIVMDHIQDVVVDANKKVAYSYTTSATRPTDEAGWTVVKRDSDITDPESAITFKRLSVYTFNLNQISSPDAFNQEENKHYDIIWEHDMSDDEDSTIVFEQQDLTYDPTLNDIVEVGGSVISEKLADNVTSFKCDLSDMETKRIIYVEMDFSKSKGRYTYHVANNVSLRNKVALSTDSISVNKGVELDTLTLTAEPGMDLPLTIRRIITKGNASNVVNYELDGGDGGRTSPGTDLTNPTTLHIDATERADIIKMNAVDSMGDAHPFDVYINRVKWTSDNAASLGESDDVEGIELIDRPTDDKIDAGTSAAITVRLNSNPGAPGIDRTKPEKVSASINSVTPATAAAIKLEPAGNLGWMLTVPGSVPKDTKIKIRFVAEHSLADGGIATRTVPYPEADGVYKDLVLTVTEAGMGVSKSPFLRGMRGQVLYPDYLRQYFNQAGQSWWDQYQLLDPSLIVSQYLVFKDYATRPCVDSDGKNINYANESAGWSITAPGAPEERYDDIGGYTSHGWRQIYGGREGNFDTSEFIGYSVDTDRQIVFAILVYTNQDGGRWLITPSIQTVMYGFREQIKRVGEFAKYESKLDLGSLYKLDSKRIDMRKKILDNVDYQVWQKEACFDNLSFGGNGGNLKLDTYVSDTPFSGGFSIGHADQDESKRLGGEPYMGSHYIYMARELPIKKQNVGDGLPQRMGDNFFNNFKDEEKTYYIWPRFSYNNSTFNRTSGYLEFKLRQGNITLKNNANSNNKMEGFVPYPEYTTDDGFTIPAHPDFYGNNYGLDEVYTSIGKKKIRHYNNNNYTGGIREDEYTCYMKLVDGIYYLRITGLADYRFSKSSQRWEFVKSNNFQANLTSGLNGANTRDVYLPGSADDEFFTGFKDISKQYNSEKKWADRIAIYSTVNGLVQYTSYKIAYYRQDGKYCVDIYTLGNGNVYKKYAYNETSEQWESRGDIFSPNIEIPRGTAVEYYYVPTKDDIEWYNYQNANDYVVPSGFMRYRRINNKWERFGNGSRDVPTQQYKYNAAQRTLYIKFTYSRTDVVEFKYDFTNNKWIRQ